MGRLMCLLGLALADAGCGKLQMESGWRTREVAVDGLDGEWQGAMTYVAKGSTVVSLLNDEAFLYLRLASADRATQAQVMRFGFTVWFDVKGGEQKTFGIHFPQGTGGRGRPFADREGGQEQAPIELPPAIAPDQLEIIGPGKGERHQVKGAEAQGVEVEVVQIEGRLVYELKIPLARDAGHPYGIGVCPGQQFSVGFETTTPDREGMRQRRGGGGRRPGGMGGGGGAIPEGMGMGGGHGGRGMGGGGRRPPGTGERPQPLQLWVKVRLAAAPLAAGQRP
ncbi:MAG: hypothetical protein HYW07_09175 [Candidatus Latescibacteria bacterium]|nr:hypothetical protein [Candidatus Latescibacterota bacterium]